MAKLRSSDKRAPDIIKEDIQRVGTKIILVQDGAISFFQKSYHPAPCGLSLHFPFSSLLPSCLYSVTLQKHYASGVPC